MNTANQYNSANKRQYKAINDRALLPLTIHQAQTQMLEDSVFDNQSFFCFSIVGRLVHFRRDSNSNMFVFNDGTSHLEGRLNLTNGKMPIFADGITFEDKYGEYFFVVLKPKFIENDRKYYIQMIREVENYDMVTKHFSDVILSTLIRKKN